MPMSKTQVQAELQMGTPYLTVKVSNISKNATSTDIKTFFSYCGTVGDIELKDGDQERSALVTFKQPYAFQTALLLNDAVLKDSKISVTPLKNSTKCSSELSEPESKNEAQQNGSGGSVIVPLPVLQAIASKWTEMHNKVMVLGETHRGPEGDRTGKVKTAITVAEQSASQLGLAILKSTCFSKSALWLSEVLDKASKYAAELGSYRNRNGTSRKQK